MPSERNQQIAEKIRSGMRLIALGVVNNFIGARERLYNGSFSAFPPRSHFFPFRPLSACRFFSLFRLLFACLSLAVFGRRALFFRTSVPRNELGGVADFFGLLFVGLIEMFGGLRGGCFFLIFNSYCLERSNQGF